MFNPEPIVVTAIDYEVTLACGKELQFTLRPDLGDVEESAESSTGPCLRLTLALSKHLVIIKDSQVAIISRREREMKLMPAKIEPRKSPIG